MSKLISIQTKKDPLFPNAVPLTRSDNIVVKLKNYTHKDNELDELSLGGVQSIVWSARVGGYSRCKIETIMSEIELNALEKDTELKINVKVEHPCCFCRLKFKIKKLKQTIQNLILNSLDESDLYSLLFEKRRDFKDVELNNSELK